MGKENRNSSEVHRSSKKVWLALAGILIIGLAISASLNLFYYNQFKSEESNVNGAAAEAAFQFRLSMWQISSTLQTNPTLDNIDNLMLTLNNHLETANNMIRMLLEYLLTNYSIQMRIIEDLLINMTSQGTNGVWDTLLRLGYESNRSSLLQAYTDLNTQISPKIADLGNEVGLAFFIGTAGNTITRFHVDAAKIENAGNIANDLKAVLNTWETKYLVS